MALGGRERLSHGDVMNDRAVSFGAHQRQNLEQREGAQEGLAEQSGSLPVLRPSLIMADRLAAARRQRFVGRVDELAFFRKALLEDTPGLAVLHVFGPGGIGKTAMLGEYARLCAEASVSAVLIDGRNVDPTPAGFLLALREILGLAENASPVDALVRFPRVVLLVDTYERLAPLDAWLRESSCPNCHLGPWSSSPGATRPAAWRADLGWSELVRTVPLRNLSPRRQPRLPAGARGGRPSTGPCWSSPTATRWRWRWWRICWLATSRRPSVPITRLTWCGCCWSALSSRCRAPLIAGAGGLCATRVTTEACWPTSSGRRGCAGAVRVAARPLLRRAGAAGLFPHDLAREVLDADLRWRDPEGFRDLHSRVLRSLVRRLRHAHGRAQQRAYFDLIYLSRHNPRMRSYYDWETMGRVHAEPAKAEDGPAILAMVHRHEGEPSAQIAAYWLGRRREAFLAFRDAGDQLVGFTAVLLLEGADLTDCAGRPRRGGCLAVSSAFTARSVPGERLMIHRFWMSDEGYQDRGAVTLAATVGGIRWLTTPRLAWSFLVVANPDLRESHFAQIGFPRAREASFLVGERAYGVFAHDWRVDPPLAWIERKGLLEFIDAAAAAPESESSAPLVALSHPDFAKAVRQALRDFNHQTALAANPLLRSRLIADRTGEAPTAALRALLREAADTLRANPKEEKLYRALLHTYLSPRPPRS